MFKIISPKIGSSLDNVTNISEKIQNEETLENIILENEILEDIDDVILTVDRCIFRNVDFSNCSFKRVDFTDVIFDNCNFSNLSISGSSLYRAHFINSKLIGTKINESFLKDVLFNGSIGQYSNFGFSKFDGVNIIDSNFSGGVFQSLLKNRVFFDNVNLKDSFFSGTSLKGIDFTTSNINGIEVRVEDVKEGIFTFEQAIELTKLMGIIIK